MSGDLTEHQMELLARVLQHGGHWPLPSATPARTACWRRCWRTSTAWRPGGCLPSTAHAVATSQSVSA